MTAPKSSAPIGPTELATAADLAAAVGSGAEAPTPSRQPTSGPAAFAYPSAPRDDVLDLLHGYQVADPYRWLEDRDSPATELWLAEQADLFAGVQQEWQTGDYWRDRLEALLGSGTISPPVWRGDRIFFMRREPGQEHAVLYCTDAAGNERILLDPMQIDPTGLTTLDSWQPTKQGHRLAYQLSCGGTEESAVYVMDVETDEILEGPIDRARYSPIGWLLDGEQYYYVRRLPPEQVPDGEEQYHRRVWLHRVGDDPANDSMIFGEHRKKTEYFGASVSRDGRWLTVSASEGTAPRNDLWVGDLANSDPAAPVLTPVQVGVDAHTGLRFGRDGRVYVYTDRDAQRGMLYVTDPTKLDPANWRTLIPEDPEAVLEGYAILDGPELERALLLVSWTRHAVSEVSIHDLDSGTRLGEIPLPGIGTIGGIVERPDGGHEAWFSYTDHATIPRVLRYDALTDECEVYAYPSGFVEVPKITSAMYSYQSKDGTEVRLMVLSPAVDSGHPAHPPRPTVLYGYGGFGISMVPSYSPSVLAWVEAGGVYAIACLRGGSEEGEHWHREGMLGKKQNVYDDFIAAAEWLIENDWTTPEQLVISGGSNGGLLVGAALTQRPELFAGVHCSAPLLDMIRYETSGLGATWNVEYGSAEVAQEFDWLAGYSPYHHVVGGTAYPATLFTTFDHDTRVDPMHARKMCAAMQAATSSSRPILLRSERDVGHGARSISRTIDLSSDVLAFMAQTTRLSPPHREEKS